MSDTWICSVFRLLILLARSLIFSPQHAYSHASHRTESLENDMTPLCKDLPRRLFKKNNCYVGALLNLAVFMYIPGAMAQETGLISQHPSLLLGGDSQYLKTATPQPTLVPRFVIDLSGSRYVRDPQTTLAKPPVRPLNYDPDYVPASITELFADTIRFPNVFQNDVTLGRERTESWYQPILFNVIGTSDKTIYINENPTQLGTLLASAKYGWSDVKFLGAAGLTNRQNVALAGLDSNTKLLIDFGVSSDPNPSLHYNNLARLELSGINLSFADPVNIVMQEPSLLNHGISLAMTGGGVNESYSGNGVLVKLTNSSIDFSQAGSFTTVPDVGNPIETNFWVAANSSEPTKSTSEITFGTNREAKPGGAPTHVFVDQNATLVFRDTGKADAIYLFPGQTNTGVGWVATPWSFHVGRQSELRFQDAYVDFDIGIAGSGAVRSLIEMNDGSRLTLTGSGSTVKVEQLTYNDRVGGSSQLALDRNTYLAVTDASFSDSSSITLATQGGDYYFQNLYLDGSTLTLSGQRNRDRSRRFDIATLDSRNNPSTLKIEGFASTLKLGDVGANSNLNIILDAAGVSGSTLDIKSIYRTNLSSVSIDATGDARIELNGATQSLESGVATTPITLRNGSIAGFYGESSFIDTTDPDVLRTFNPATIDPINLGPNGYSVRSFSGESTGIYLNGEVFLNQGFGQLLAGNTGVEFQPFSAGFVGDSCDIPSFGTKCQWNRSIGTIDVPRLVNDYDTALYFDIGIDGSGLAINDKIQTQRLDVRDGLRLVVNTLPGPSSSSLPSAQDLNGKVFPLITSSDSASSGVGANYQIVKGDSMPAVTDLFWYENPNQTKQFILGARTDLGALQKSASTRNQRGMAQTLTLTQPVVSSSGTGTSVPTDVHNNITLQSATNLTTALLNLNQSQWRQLSEIHAEPYASFMTVGLEQNLMVADAVMAHAAGAPKFSDKTVSGLFHDRVDKTTGTSDQLHGPKKYLWGDMQFSKGRVDAQNDLAGYDYQLGSLIFGADLYESGKDSAGLFAGLGFSNMGNHDASHASFQSLGLNLGAYGRRQLEQAINVTATVGVNWDFIDSSRTIANIGDFTGGRAKGDYKSVGTFAGLRLDRSFKLASQRSLIKPVVELTYAKKSFDSVYERDAGDLGFNVSSGNADALVGGIGFELSHAWDQAGIGFTIDTMFRYERDFFADMNSHHSLNMQSQLTRYNAMVYGIDRGAHGLTAGLGVKMLLNKSMSLTTGYKYTNWSHGPEQQFGAHLTVRW